MQREGFDLWVRLCSFVGEVSGRRLIRIEGDAKGQSPCRVWYICSTPASEGCSLHRHRSRHAVPKTDV